MIKNKKTEITEKLRKEINKVVNRYIDQGIAELVPGVLFIDEVHMLDIECFSFLNRALESDLAPIVIFATNRAKCKIRGTDILSSHGIPRDLLDRLIIIRTQQYDQTQIRSILEIRSRIEKLHITNEALQQLSIIGDETSLRHAVHLLTPCRIIASTDHREEINIEDVKEAAQLFLHCKQSALNLQGPRQSKYLM